MGRFVLEIGTEEIPARFLEDEQSELLKHMTRSLEAAGVSFEQITALATPRRLALLMEGLPECQDTREEILVGPPVSAAYDSAGVPTKALLGFAQSNGITPDTVFRQDTSRGEYVACRKLSGGKPTIEVLGEICPHVIESIPFGKRMRWGSLTFPYARPIVWILALLDGEVVPFRVAGLDSGQTTQGHRVHGRGPHTIEHAAAYEKTLEEKGQITISPKARRDAIVSRGNEIAAGLHGQMLWKDSLLTEVVGLVEHPVPMLGDFDPSYLEIPEEVLLTSMESHQKSFGLRGADGKLLPHFLTVLNISPKDLAVVKKGWERVLRARLEDARFFWHTDLKDNFDTWLAKLENVIFIGQLGSMGEKSRRLMALCQWLVAHLPPQDLTADEAARAGQLAKADLVSAMVGEFDTLQGIMGGIYAEKWDESPAVAQAIKEQYLPAGPDTPLPQSALGGILSLADKTDTLVGCFGLKQIPTGASDPNGLRRCALGIIRILISRQWQANVENIFREAQRLYGEKPWKLAPEEALQKLLEFFRGRLRNYFMLKGYDTNYVDAAMASGYLNPVDTKERLDALVAFSKNEAFLAAAQTIKRVENVGKKAAKDTPDHWQETLLENDAEKQLAAKLNELLPKVDAALNGRDFPQVLLALTAIREPVDNFFANVLVMCDNAAVRENRLAMLNAISRRFATVAQFSALQL